MDGIQMQVARSFAAVTQPANEHNGGKRKAVAVSENRQGENPEKGAATKRSKISPSELRHQNNVNANRAKTDATVSEAGQGDRSYPSRLVIGCDMTIFQKVKQFFPNANAPGISAQALATLTSRYRNVPVRPPPSEPVSKSPVPKRAVDNHARVDNSPAACKARRDDEARQAFRNKQAQAAMDKVRDIVAGTKMQSKLPQQPRAASPRPSAGKSQSQPPAHAPQVQHLQRPPNRGVVKATVDPPARKATAAPARLQHKQHAASPHQSHQANGGAGGHPHYAPNGNLHWYPYPQHAPQQPRPQHAYQHPRSQQAGWPQPQQYSPLAPLAQPPTPVSQPKQWKPRYKNISLRQNVLSDDEYKTRAAAQSGSPPGSPHANVARGSTESDQLPHHIILPTAKNVVDLTQDKNKPLSQLPQTGSTPVAGALELHRTSVAAGGDVALKERQLDDSIDVFVRQLVGEVAVDESGPSIVLGPLAVHRASEKLDGIINTVLDLASDKARQAEAQKPPAKQDEIDAAYESAMSLLGKSRELEIKITSLQARLGEATQNQDSMVAELAGRRNGTSAAASLQQSRDTLETAPPSPQQELTAGEIDFIRQDCTTRDFTELDRHADSLCEAMQNEVRRSLLGRVHSLAGSANRG